VCAFLLYKVRGRQLYGTTKDLPELSLGRDFETTYGTARGDIATPSGRLGPTVL
jgi:hypothetical protein